MKDGCSCLALAGVLIFNLLLGGISTQYVIQFWGAYLTHHPILIPFWVCALAGLFLGEIAVPAAIITWLVSFCL